MKKLLSLIFLLILYTACSKPGKFPVLEGPYLGQNPPGKIPEVFAPGIVSTGYYERSMVFSPDLDELFFQMRGIGFTTFILTMKIQKKKWSQPEVAFFSGLPEYSDDCPFITYNGKNLFFASKRPLPGSENILSEPDLWVIRKEKEEWGKPEHLSSVINSSGEDHYPTVSKMNNIYFNSNRSGNYDIYVSEYSESGCSEPVRLDAPVNTDHFEGHPFIAADESYLIFSADRPDQLGNCDIYVSYRKKDKTWSEPINMGDKINSPYHEAAPYVSPDGKYLFFCSFRLDPKPYSDKKFKYRDIIKMLSSPGNRSGDIYWVDAEIIEELKPDDLK